MAETFVDRARVIMARIKDNTSPLDSKVSPAIAINNANAVIIVHRKDLLQDEFGAPINIADISNEDKAKAYVNYLRNLHEEIRSASRVPQAGKAAREAEKAAVSSEVTSELGGNE